MFRSSFLVCACLFFCASVAQGSPLTFSFAGMVDSTIGYYDPGFISDPSGTGFTGTYTFDDGTSDGAGGGASGAYTGSGLSIVLAGVPFAFGSVSIGVSNFAGLDQYLVGFEDSPTLLSIELNDLQGSVFASDALPITAPPLAAFDSRMLRFTFTDTSGNLWFDLNGEIKSLTCVDGCDTTPPTPVPEPATISLLAGGLGVLLARRRARRS